MTDQFFESQSEQSRVKAKIVSDYFIRWSKVMVNNVKKYDSYATDKIIYLDLYSGPGSYDDGSFSTPILILNYALADADMRDHLLCIFNDADEESIKKLENKVVGLPNICDLKYAPKFFQGQVDSSIENWLKNTRMPPTLLFADPFGYKGVTLELINSVLKDFGGESIFFFNYNRTQSAIKNSKVEGHMDALFGKQRADKLRELENGTGDQKEEEIINALVDALTEKYGRYYCLFRFPSLKKDMTSHYLVYVTKGALGYEYMQDVMYKNSDYIDSFGIASFKCEPSVSPQLSFFNPLQDLAAKLSRDFKGSKKILNSFWLEHSVGSRFIRKNYVEAVKLLGDQGLVSFEGSVPKQRSQCSDKTIICFK